MLRRSLIAGASAGAMSTIALSAQASPQFPSRPIRAVVPFAPGGNADTLARIIVDRLSPRLGQPIVVDNKTGAASMIGAAYVAKSEKDGYTLFFGVSAIFLTVQLIKNPPLRMSELMPVTRIHDVGVAMGIPKDLGVDDLAGYLKLTKEQPGKHSYGSYGVGTGAHVIAEIMKKRSGAVITHVPYRGEAPAVQDLLAGNVTSAFGSVGSLAQFPDKIRIVAVLTPKRLRQFPDIPTFAEAGFDMGPITGWAGVFVATGTPAPIVEKLAANINAVCAMPDVQARILEMGYQPVEPQKDLSNLIAEQERAWKAAAEEADVTID
jgi:tripartite-type tricarboxylate transporter receptor subunit TctC